MAVRRVVIDKGSGTQRENESQSITTGGNRSMRTRICVDCEEPVMFAERIENEWVCTACVSRRKQDSRSEPETLEDRNIYEAYKNKD